MCFMKIQMLVMVNTKVAIHPGINPKIVYTEKTIPCQPILQIEESEEEKERQRRWRKNIKINQAHKEQNSSNFLCVKHPELSCSAVQ